MSEVPLGYPSSPSPVSLLSDDDKRFIVRALAAQAFATRTAFAGLSMDEAVRVIERWIGRASTAAPATAEQPVVSTPSS